MTEPLIDVIMLVSHHPNWADLAIRAVEHHTKAPYRLIVVDQATTHPDFKPLLESAKQRGHTVLRLAENRSFSNGNNAGVRVGSAKFIVILNDDALVTEGWDAAMIQDMSEKAVGLVGARTNYAAGPTSDPSWVGEPPFMAFVCVGLRREVWDKVGPLDEENFTGFSSEDLDYCWRVRKAGYKLKVSNAYVLHAGSRSIVSQVSGGTKDAQLARANYNSHNEKFNRVLVDKWGKEWVEEHTKLRQKVLVVSYHAEEWTRVRFAGSLVTLKGGFGAGSSGGVGPEGQNFGFTYYQHTRTPIHLARQLVCDYACNNGFDVLVQLDDDATFPSDLLGRLLSHQKEVVTALAFQRKQPYLPCIYEWCSDGFTGTPLEGWENTGLRKVDVSGFHVSALRMSVIKKLRDAKITQYFGGFENKVGEDFAFCGNLKKIGVQVYCDTNLIAGHIGEGVIVDAAYKQAHREGRAL